MQSLKYLLQNHFIADDPKQLNQIDILELEGDLSVEVNTNKIKMNKNVI